MLRNGWQDVEEVFLMLNKFAHAIGTFSYKYRKAIAIFAAVLLVVVIIGETFASISFHYSESNLVTEIFPTDDTVVVVYDNRDEEHIQTIINTLLEDEKVISIQAYANTLGTALSSKELSDNFGIDSMLTNALFVMYNSDISQESITLQEFAKFIASDEFLNNSTFNSNLDEATKKQLIQFSQIIQALDSNVPMSSNDIASMSYIEIMKSNLKNIEKVLNNETVNDEEYAKVLDLPCSNNLLKSSLISSKLFEILRLFLIMQDIFLFKCNISANRCQLIYNSFIRRIKKSRIIRYCIYFFLIIICSRNILFIKS